MSTTRRIVIAAAIVFASLGFAGCAAEVAGTPVIAASSQPVAAAPSTQPAEDHSVAPAPVEPVAHVTSPAAHQAVETMALDEGALIDLYTGAGARVSASEMAGIGAAAETATAAVNVVSGLISAGAYSPVELSAIHDMSAAGSAIADDMVALASNDTIRVEADQFVAAFAVFEAN